MGATVAARAKRGGDGPPPPLGFSGTARDRAAAGGRGRRQPGLARDPATTGGRGMSARSSSSRDQEGHVGIAELERPGAGRRGAPWPCAVRSWYPAVPSEAAAALRRLPTTRRRACRPPPSSAAPSRPPGLASEEGHLDPAVAPGSRRQRLNLGCPCRRGP